MLVVTEKNKQGGKLMLLFSTGFENGQTDTAPLKWDKIALYFCFINNKSTVVKDGLNLL